MTPEQSNAHPLPPMDETPDEFACTQADGNTAGEAGVVGAPPHVTIDSDNDIAVRAAKVFSAEMHGKESLPSDRVVAAMRVAIQSLQEPTEAMLDQVMVGLLVTDDDMREAFRSMVLEGIRCPVAESDCEPPRYPLSVAELGAMTDDEWTAYITALRDSAAGARAKAIGRPYPEERHPVWPR